MTGRALIFSNPSVIQLIKDHFVAYAGDQWYLHRQNDANGKFFWKVAQQGHYKDRPESETRQGIYVATPDGALLGSINSWSLENNLALFRSAEARWERQPKGEGASPVADAPDEALIRKPPVGGLILNVFARIPLTPTEEWTANQATGRDHMWLTAGEWRSLLPLVWKNGTRYAVPAAIAERLTRFHLVDNVRGEPDMWIRDDIHQASFTLVVDDEATGLLRLEGAVALHHGDARGYDAHVQGYLVHNRQKNRFTRMDLLSWGEAWGEGHYTGGAPKGRFPLVIALSLAGAADADQTPPQGIRNAGEYLGNTHP